MHCTNLGDTFSSISFVISKVSLLQTMLLYVMVLILDGNSELGVYAWRKVGLFGEKKSDL